MSFPFWPSCFVLFGTVKRLSSALPHYIWDTFQPWGLIFQCHIFLPFSVARGVFTANTQEWFAIPFSSGSHFVTTLHYNLSVLGGPAQHGFIELCKPLRHNKAVIHEGGIHLLQVRQREVGCYQRLQMGDLKIYCLSFSG